MYPVPEDHPFHVPGTWDPPAFFEEPGYLKMPFIEQAFAGDWTNWWAPNAACSQAMLRAAGFSIEANPEADVYLCRVAPVPYARYGPAAVYPAREHDLIEAAMIWNEPSNKSHWDPELDPDWSIYADTVIRAGTAIAQANPALKRVLGGLPPIDPMWLGRLRELGALDAVDVVAVHGFPIDWNLWPIHAWPDKIAEVEAAAPDKEVWVTEVGVGSFGAEEVQVFGVQRTAEFLVGRVPRISWYSLFDLPLE